MALQKELKDLLTQSYSRINDLNGLMNKRDMEDALEQNGLKAKSKARAIIANFHLLLDAFFKHLLRTIDGTVMEISDTLKQHSNEIEEYVMYTAQLCLIAEKFLKEDHVNEHEGLTLKQRLLESLEDSSVLKTIDYKAFVSLDLDINMNDLFALPFIHIVSQSSEDSEIRKVHSLKFEDLKQEAKDSTKGEEPVPGSVNVSVKDSKQTVPQKMEGSSGHSSVSKEDGHEETIPPSTQGNFAQDEIVSRRPLNFKPVEEHSPIFTQSARQMETSKPMMPETSGKYGSVVWHDKKKKDLDISLPTTYFHGSHQENTVRLQRDKDERTRCDDTVVISWDDPFDSGYDTLPLVSPGKGQESSPSYPNPESQQDFSAKYHEQFVPSPNTIPKRLISKVESLNVTPSSSSHGCFNPESIRTNQGPSVDQSSCIAPNVMDRNLTLLQNCLRNAEKQSIILQSLPQRHV